MKSKRAIPAQVQPVVSQKTYLKDIAKILENLAIEMENAQSTNICFAYVPDHISTKGKINMCLEYIKTAVINFKG